MLLASTSAHSQSFPISHTRFICSLFVRLLLFFTVVVPKFVIAILLSHYGSGFVVTSDTLESLILKCLSVSVFMTVDELLFISFTPGAFKDVLKTMPPIHGNKSKIHNAERVATNARKKEARNISWVELCGIVFRPFLILITLGVLIGSARLNHCEGE